MGHSWAHQLHHPQLDFSLKALALVRQVTPSRSILRANSRASLPPSQNTIPQPSIVFSTSALPTGKRTHRLRKPVCTNKVIFNQTAPPGMWFHLCELISLSTALEQPAGNGPCWAPRDVCSRQCQDRRTVPRLGTHQVGSTLRRGLAVLSCSLERRGRMTQCSE